MILELKNIQLSFTTSIGAPFNLLDGVTFSVPKNQVTALVGGNGSGKTTLFNIISGFIPNYKGEILFEGKDLKGIPAHQIASLGIGRLFQGRQLMTDLSILDNMKIASSERFGENPIEAIFRSRKIKEEEEKRTEKAITILKDLFGEGSKYLNMLSKPAGSISYGEQRLIALARLMMADYKLLLLDEPTSGVNPKYISIFGNIIQKMVHEKGLSVLLIEHNMNFVKDLAEQCAYLDEGRICFRGRTDEVLSNQDVKNSYLGL